MENDNFQHYGVAGMHWGQRKEYVPTGRRARLGMKPTATSRFNERLVSGSSSTYRIKTSEAFKRRIAETKKGDKVLLERDDKESLAVKIGKHINPEKMADNYGRDNQYSIKVGGKTVGNLEIYQEDNQTMNVTWVDIDESQRGKGYATAVMKEAKKIAKESGNKFVTLEVPGISPDARHIYESLGFKDEGQISDSGDVWGGLTAMKFKV